MQKFPVLLYQQKVIDVKHLIYWHFKNVSFRVVEFESIRCRLSTFSILLHLTYLSRDKFVILTD